MRAHDVVYLRLPSQASRVGCFADAVLSRVPCSWAFTAPCAVHPFCSSTQSSRRVTGLVLRRSFAANVCCEVRMPSWCLTAFCVGRWPGGGSTDLWTFAAAAAPPSANRQWSSLAHALSQGNITHVSARIVGLSCLASNVVNVCTPRVAGRSRLLVLCLRL